MRQLARDAVDALANVQVIIAANRGPFAWKVDDPAHPEAGRLVMTEGGGVIPGMSALARATGATWVATAIGDQETPLADLADQGPLGVDWHNRFRMAYVRTPKDRYDAFYATISNPMLWFIQHQLWDLANGLNFDDAMQTAWDDGYVAVNRGFAETIVAAAARDPRPPVVMLADYHLYLASQMIRAQRPDAVIQQFVHIPWPEPHAWSLLPREMRDQVLNGLLGNDVIGFQTQRDADNFLRCCTVHLGLMPQGDDIVIGGRTVQVRHYPIGPDVDNFTALARNPVTQRHLVAMQTWRPDSLVVRVDRMDPSKNIVRGFLAFERMLERHPELIGHVQFYAFLQPTRGDITEYAEYQRTIAAQVARINARADLRAANGMEPIRLEIGQDIHRAAAAYMDYDVLVINSIADGMVLVAKEGPLVNRRNGSTVLSTEAGSHPELAPWALSVNPFHVDDMARAMYTGVVMDLQERGRRITAMRAHVRRHDMVEWIENQVRDIAGVLQGRGIRPGRQEPPGHFLG